MPPRSKDRKKRIIVPPKKIGGGSVKAQAILNSLPHTSLNNIQLAHFAKKLRVSNFRGVYMRDTLPSRPLDKECGILNLDESCSSGTHWVAYRKTGAYVKYFDSLGNRGPPKELVKYLQGCRITFNCKAYQSPISYLCGHLCLLFLLNLL